MRDFSLSVVRKLHALGERSWEVPFHFQIRFTIKIGGLDVADALGKVAMHAHEICWKQITIPNFDNVPDLHMHPLGLLLDPLTAFILNDIRHGRVEFIVLCLTFSVLNYGFDCCS